MKQPAESSSRMRAAAGAVLLALLLVLAFRLTASEILRESLAQKMATVALQEAPKTADSPEAIPIIGPVFTASYAAITWLLAGSALVIAWQAGALSLFRKAQLGVMGVILVLVLISTRQAGNPFNALVGALDLLTSLAAAATVLLLCDRCLLGDRGRQVLIAALLAILVLGVAKAFMQQFLEFPETQQMFEKDPDKAMRENGIDPTDPVQSTLFKSRLKSAEVSGFGGMSNVFATQMIAWVTLLAALGLAGILFKKHPVEPLAVTAGKRRGRPERSPELASGQIPLHVIALVIVGLLLVAGLMVLPWTGSKGGLAAAIMAVVTVILGGFWRQQVAARRRALLALAGTLAVLLPVVIVVYGIAHHGLPTRSLFFRWQYWTATVPIIEGHKLWGVGLFNFGDYYLRFKSPAAPEDVKDPHNFFMRLVAEAGIPAAIAVGVLLLAMLRGAFARTVVAVVPTEDGDLRQPLMWGAVGAVGWMLLHFLAESPNEYTVIMTFLLALLAWSVFAAIMGLFAGVRPEATRYVALAAVVAALAMLLYDQVNMALVTGPVAMLFWMLLATGDGRDTEMAVRPKAKWPIWLLGVVFVGTSLWFHVAVILPMGSDSFGWDPAPYEYRYIRQMRANDVPAAMAALDAAIERSPNSVELLLQRIGVRRVVLHQKVAGDIRRVLQLDRSNANVRLMVALPESDLPAAERRRALEEALAFDRELPPLEPKHLTEVQLRKIRGTMARMPGLAWFKF